jgi:hypothetical protein
MSEKWKPIESAPRDETRILGARFVGVRLDWVNECWWPTLPHGTMWKTRSGYCSPTHWIDPPELEEAS